MKEEIWMGATEFRKEQAKKPAERERKRRRKRERMGGREMERGGGSC